MKAGQGRSARLASCAAALPHLLIAAVTVLLVEHSPARVSAQVSGQSSGLPRAALLTTSRVKSGPQAERDAALDDVVHTALDRLEVVDVVARPAIDLEAIQLSLDCVGETPQCLLAVAKHTRAEVLIAPSIQRAGPSLVLSILYFDARGATELRRASRRQPGVALQPDTLDEVPNMLRELFKLEPEKPEPPPEVAEPPQPEVSIGDEAYPESPDADHGEPVPVGPFLLGGGGLLALGAGAAVGLLVLQKTEDDYAAIEVNSMEAAAEAADKRDEGQTQALVTTILIGTGAAALVAGGVWLAAELDSGEESPETASLQPVIGPDRAGLVLTGTFGGGP